MKVLAIKLRQMGDTVLWTAALEALFEIPDIELSIAFPEDYGTFFQHDARYARKFPLKPNLCDNLGLISTIRNENYDVALNFHASSQSRWLTRLSGARKKLVHFHTRNHPSPGIPGSGIPMAATERDLNVVRALGWNGSSPSTRLVLSDGVRELGQSKLASARVETSGGPLVLLAPAASRKSKQWSFDRWLKLAEDLRSDFRPAFLLPDRRIRSPFEIRTWETVAPVIETKTIEELVGVISHGKVFVGSDSGAKHIACAIGVPTVTLFGPESLGEWHCYSSPKHVALQIPVGCRNLDPEPRNFSWCSAENCPLASHACLSLIEPDAVKKAISQVA